MSCAWLTVGCGVDGSSDESAGDAALRRGDLLLSKTEERQVLRALDDICSDAWCAGDFDFAFKKLDCRRSTRSCTLELEYVHHFYDLSSDEESAIGELRLPTTCAFSNIRSRADVMAVELGRVIYSDRLADLVTECLSEDTPRALLEAAKFDVTFVVNACSSADASDVTVANVASEAWDRDAMIARAKALGAENGFPEGALTYEASDALPAELTSDDRCRGWTSKMIAYRSLVSVTATNPAGDRATVVLIRRAWSGSPVQETVIHLAANAANATPELNGRSAAPGH